MFTQDIKDLMIDTVFTWFEYDKCGYITNIGENFIGFVSRDLNTGKLANFELIFSKGCFSLYIREQENFNLYEMWSICEFLESLTETKRILLNN